MQDTKLASVDDSPSPPNQKRRQGTFSSLADSNFRLLYFGNLLQFGSMQMQQLVRGWLVFHLTGSFAALGLMSLANALPGLAVAPFGGAIADRVPKKTVIQICQLYNAGNAAVLAIIAGGFFGLHLEFWHLFLSGFLQGGVNSVMQPSRQSIINDLVGPERLMNAIGINSTGQTLMQLIGPGVGGFMLGVLDPSAVFWVMAAMYALAVTFTARLPKRPLFAYEHSGDRRHKSRGRAGAMFSEVGDGLKYVWRDQTIRTLIAVNFLIVVVAMPYTMLLPGFVRTVLCPPPDCSAGHSGTLQGWLQSTQGIGAIVASFVVASGMSRGRGKLQIFWGVLLGAAILAFSVSQNFWITLPIMLLIGAGQAGRMATGQVLIQTYAADEYRGRVSAVWFMQFSLVQLGTFFVGILAELVGIQVAIGGLALLLVIAMFAVLLMVPTIRDLD
ncbi:MAG: MFS transporter [Dehalococcoidia bacterium]